MRLGFMIETVSGSQLSFYLIQYANKAISEGHEVVLFHNTPVPFDIPFTGGLLPMQESFGFRGDGLIATNLNLASQLIKFPGTKRKLFYVWDLEWTRFPMQYKNFAIFAQVYNNPLLQLIARSKDHAQIISQCWNRKVSDIVDNCNIDEIIKICR